MARKSLSTEQIGNILQATDPCESEGEFFDDEADIDYQPDETCTSSEEDEFENLVTRNEQSSGKIKLIE